jgi:hypothetical protein
VVEGGKEQKFIISKERGLLEPTEEFPVSDYEESEDEDPKTETESNDVTEGDALGE